MAEASDFPSYEEALIFAYEAIEESYSCNKVGLQEKAQGHAAEAQAWLAFATHIKPVSVSKFVPFN